MLQDDLMNFNTGNMKCNSFSICTSSNAIHESQYDIEISLTLRLPKGEPFWIILITHLPEKNHVLAFSEGVERKIKTILQLSSLIEEWVILCCEN